MTSPLFLKKINQSININEQKPPSSIFRLGHLKHSIDQIFSLDESRQTPVHLLNGGWGRAGVSLLVMKIDKDEIDSTKVPK